ncbi:MAG TPA: prepilin-type N-terminal cleavage/methylation domain-containing protein [Candidatus Saccharimonadales bacterium]
MRTFNKKNQHGFTLIEFLLILSTLMLIITAGGYLWVQNHKISQTISPHNTKLEQPISKVASESPSQLLSHLDGWENNNSFKSFGFTFMSPLIGWQINSLGVPGSGNTRTWISEAGGYGLSTKEAQFAININISTDEKIAKSYNGILNYSTGRSLGKLSNGIVIWQSNLKTYKSSDSPYCGGGHYNRTVILEAASGNSLYVRLPNGTYMTYRASFCQPTYGQNLNLGYSQQANSTEMLTAAELLGTIKFN